MAFLLHVSSGDFAQWCNFASNSISYIKKNILFFNDHTKDKINDIEMTKNVYTSLLILLSGDGLESKFKVEWILLKK